ncbi:MAG: LPS translocon maturation chaperone LptM [Gammaproteobacteria bacterium]
MTNRRIVVLAVAVVFCAALPALSGCGQTGPLYLPQHKGKHAPMHPPAPQTIPPPVPTTQ